MIGRNGELVPGSWSLVRESTRTTGLRAQGRYSEPSGHSIIQGSRHDQEEGGGAGPSS